ncbi:MAG TPA: leucine-rich repeat domain-containing protein [Clostridia bacterium]|nr:leucine-rich repeat domain-containing protein [Clostridia bacterium]
MKRFISVLLLILLAASLAACSQPSSKPEVTQTPEPEKTVVFSDPLLEEMVRAAMNKPEGDITLAEAEKVTELKLSIDWQQEPAPNTQIKDISGLENFKNLEILELLYHAITDISPLAGLTKLTSLSLGGNPIADITPLAGLTSLGSLTLFNCQAQDYTPLANLTGLGMLLMEYSTISDVSMLSGLTELWWLGLANTQVSDVSPLSTLTNLKKLQLAGCPVSDYTPLAAIYPNLEEADFSIVASLRALGFTVNDSAPHVESYKTEEMYVLVNCAEWGEMDTEDEVNMVLAGEVNMVLLCRNYGTENEIMVIYYPDEKQFLVLSLPQDFRYAFDVKTEEMSVEYGAEKASAFIEEAYDEADPYLLLTPIKDFERVMTDTFGISANTLFTLPRETEAVQSSEQPSASGNSLIGLGFGFDDAGTCGVYEEHEHTT